MLLHRTMVKPTTAKASQTERIVITPRESGSLIASTLIGVGVLTLPRSMSEVAREGAWLTTILGGLVTLALLIIWTRLSFRFPLKSMASYAPEILGPKNASNIMGKIVAAPFIIGFIGYWLFAVAVVLRAFGEVVVTTVLVNTPLEVIILTMLFLAYMLTLYEVDVVARVNELVLPLIVIPVVLIILFSLQSFRLEYFLPLWPDLRLKDLLQGILISVFAYLGYEIITVFGGYTFVTKKTLPANVGGFLTSLFINTAIVIVAVGSFGVEELQKLLWPTFELVKVTEVPGVILERVESAFLGVWVAAVFTSSANLIYAASFLAKKFVGKGKTHICALFFIPLIYWLALLPENVHILFEWQTYAGYAGLMASGAVPILLSILARIRKIGLYPPPYVIPQNGHNQHNQLNSQQLGDHADQQRNGTPDQNSQNKTNNNNENNSR
ncbi:spore germination protein [Caldalkalibacillus thermarum TA2.A1]|uniref:Spore germination protein n=1 Tax=Caldalkalibacillus thermarum (strain TA2.A1) TaxID=986075 RepID=F5L7E8_CALTT|nr:endospore germination permease [Caldalkalibacillus thermarum]EGL82740.1 spore germination protein [Caldalkalibacillus thermarum TA2.A1]QZT32562.1 spore germination protein [Caldalkalibacillus thermarum TA2.A1]